MDGQLLSGVAVLVFVVFLWAGVWILRGIGQMAAARRHDDQDPVREQPAVVVGRRVEVEHERTDQERTRYHVTFELEGGERVELPVAGVHFDELAEGDRGTLVYQGTRLVSFSRDRTIEAR